MQYLIRVPEISPNWMKIRHTPIDILEVRKSPNWQHSNQLYDILTEHSLNINESTFRKRPVNAVIKANNRSNGFKVEIFDSFQEAYDAKIKYLQDVQNKFYTNLESMAAALPSGIHPSVLVKKP